MLKDDLIKLSQKTGKDILTTFKDFLDYTIGYFGVGGTKKIEGWNYTSEQNKLFYDAFYGLITDEYKPGIDRRGWCDPLGDTFMDLGKGFASMRGQYFTPVDLCDLMAETTLQGPMPEGQMTTFGKRPTIDDPTCGSSRNLLAAHVRAMETLKWPKKPYLVGEDIDPMCCKMSAINLCVHGCYGEVVCHNTLTDPKGVTFGYVINETMCPMPCPMPSIRRSDKKKDFFVCGYGVD